MSARKTPMLALAALTLGLTLTACGNSGTGGTDAAATTTPAATATSAAQSPTRTATPSTTPADGGTQPDQGTGEKCTDQVDYAGDPRSNAEINSIGEDTGTCPPVQDK
ncbi:hypothetical protein [Streptomyces violaceorubidus]|uniref:Secreted protein n=1 Tax=Streptomyces violaceorubidus TaxID=284042 RepID=A0ABV1T207_9ACTN